MAGDAANPTPAGSPTRLTAAEVLAAIPHGAPFRFVEDILEVDDEHIVASCRFDADADFYRGHFPGNPITPGVLLLEAMAQAGVVAHGIYLMGRPGLEPGRELLTLFTQAEAEFLGIVRPGERVVVHARRLTFRHRLLRSKVRMTREDGSLVCEATLTGVGVVGTGTFTKCSEVNRSANSVHPTGNHRDSAKLENVPVPNSGGGR
jgi:3-hydroxyacyl-[acyl-carrier-protein] dehydratase